MRPLVFLGLSTLALTGCLSAPTGRAGGADDDAGTDAPIDAEVLSWPPASADIVAIGAGRFDAGPLDDLVVLDASGDKVWLLTGGRDVEATRTTSTTASRSVELAGLTAPAAVLVGAHTLAKVIVVDSPASGPRVTLFDGDLHQYRQFALPGAAVPAAGDLVTLSHTGFGQSVTGSVFITLPGSVHFIEDDFLDDETVEVRTPQPGAGQTAMEALSQVRSVAGYRTPNGARVVISELTVAQHGTAIPMMDWLWSTLRTGGASWPAQAVASVSPTDPSPDIVAYQPGPPASICVLDPEGAEDGCATTTFNPANVRIAVGSLSAAGTHDLAVVDQNTPQGLFVAPNLRYEAPDWKIDAHTVPLDLRIPNPRVALADLDGQAGLEILTVGSTGTVLCSRYPGATAAPVGCGD